MKQGDSAGLWGIATYKQVAAVNAHINNSMDEMPRLSTGFGKEFLIFLLLFLR